jgi:hypothetical protein
MFNRRGVLKFGAATVAGVLGKMPTSARPAFHRAIFDERFAECREFAAELNSLGIRTSAICGDVATLWYGDLKAHLSENRLPIAGSTDRAALFCLEELARDVGMRVIFRADHIIDQNGHTQHSAVGPASPVAVVRNLRQQGDGFGRTMAVLFSQFDIREPRDMAAQKHTGPFSPENKTALVSWLIA